MNVSDQSPRASLKGRHVLIVEDEPFIAFDLVCAIEDAGGVALGPAMSVQEALALIEKERVEAAILDVNLPDGDIGPVISALENVGTQFLVHTGAGLTPELKEQYPSLRVFNKPTPPPVLADVIAASLAGHREAGTHHP